MRHYLAGHPLAAQLMPSTKPAVWFPTVRTGTGTDVFTQRLVAGLQQRGIRAEITWLPLRAEYLPWTVRVRRPPQWATLVHVNTWLHSRFLPKHLPLVATIHHAVHDPALRPYKGAVRAAYHRCWIAPNERRIMRRADRVIAVSHFVAEVARRTLVDVPMQVIHNGINTDRFRPGTRQLQSAAPFQLLYVGSWKTLKGVKLLAPILRELGEGFELCYTGGPAAARDKAHMPTNMHDIGRLNGEDAVIAAMQQADAFLFPSRSEGLPLSGIEAMACGLPVVAARASSMMEVVDDAKTGMLCDVDNVVAFADAVRRLATHADLQAALSQAARQRVVDMFSIEAVFSAYTQVFAEDMESGNEPRGAACP